MKKMLIIVAICTFVALPVYADLVFYEDSAGKTAFEASSIITIVEDFESFPTKGVNIHDPITLQGVTYTSISSNPKKPPNLHVAPAGYTNFGVIPATTSSILTASGNEDFMVDLSAVDPITAMGFDTYVNGKGDVTITIVNADGPTSTTYNHNKLNVGFFGVASSSPISSIQWTAIGGEFINTGIDNLQVGVVPIHSPVPSAFLLGILGLGVAGRKLRGRRTA
jgi:hypothetical protein